MSDLELTMTRNMTDDELVRAFDNHTDPLVALLAERLDGALSEIEELEKDVDHYEGR